MEIHLTERAAAEYERISSGAMTPEMASEYLRDGRIQLRTFAESLDTIFDCVIKRVCVNQIYSYVQDADFIGKLGWQRNISSRRNRHRLRANAWTHIL